MIQLMKLMNENCQLTISIFCYDILSTVEVSGIFIYNRRGQRELEKVKSQERQKPRVLPYFTLFVIFSFICFCCVVWISDKMSPTRVWHWLDKLLVHSLNANSTCLKNFSFLDVIVLKKFVYDKRQKATLGGSTPLAKTLSARKILGY